MDAVNDLIPICPNCHLVIHAKEPEYAPQEIKKMLKNKGLYNTIEYKALENIFTEEFNTKED